MGPPAAATVYNVSAGWRSVGLTPAFCSYFHRILGGHIKRPHPAPVSVVLVLCVCLCVFVRGVYRVCDPIRCLGGGVDLITACDVRFCTADASFAILETKLAIVAGTPAFVFGVVCVLCGSCCGPQRRAVIVSMRWTLCSVYAFVCVCV